MPLDLFAEPVQRSACISPCGLYRYRLDRSWSGEHALPFVMLNPSTADAKIDDPTIRRCMGFARREGAGGIIVVNVYAFRATSPVDLFKATDPHGPDNDLHLARIAHWGAQSGMPIVCAWGAHGNNTNRHVAMLAMFGARLVCLGTTKDGQPRHPLYVRGDQPLVPFR